MEDDLAAFGDPILIHPRPPDPTGIPGGRSRVVVLEIRLQPGVPFPDQRVLLLEVSRLPLELLIKTHQEPCAVPLSFVRGSRSLLRSILRPQGIEQARQVGINILGHAQVLRRSIDLKDLSQPIPPGIVALGGKHQHEEELVEDRRQAVFTG